MSRPDICAHLATIDSGINALCESGVYRINELVRDVKEWQRAASLNYAWASLSHVEDAGVGWADPRGPSESELGGSL